MSRRIDGNGMTLIGENGELKVETEILNDKAVMKLSGCVYMDIEDDLFDEAAALLSAGKHVIMNCKELEMLSPTACQKLILIYRRAAVPGNRRVELCGVSDELLEQLQACDVDYIISEVRQEV